MQANGPYNIKSNQVFSAKKNAFLIQRNMMDKVCIYLLNNTSQKKIK